MTDDRYRAAWLSARRRANDRNYWVDAANMWRRTHDGMQRDLHQAERDAYLSHRQAHRDAKLIAAVTTYADKLTQSAAPQYRKAGRDLLALLDGDQDGTP